MHASASMLHLVEGEELEIQPQIMASWSGTRLVRQFVLRPVPIYQAHREDVRHTQGPHAWGPQPHHLRPRIRTTVPPRGAIPEPQNLQPDVTRVQWIAQRSSISEKPAHSGPRDRRRALAINQCKSVNREWNERFVHGSPVLDGGRRWPDASNNYKHLPRHPHRFGLSPASPAASHADAERAQPAWGLSLEVSRPVLNETSYA